MINLGQLKEIKDLRKVWPHEALDFTPWLAEEENLMLLSDAVGLEITVEETESSVGDFNVDIYATETGTDRKIMDQAALAAADAVRLILTEGADAAMNLYNKKVKTEE